MTTPTPAQGRPCAASRIPVLIVNSTLHIGGAENVAACLAERLDRQLFDVAACYLKEPGAVARQMVRGGVELLELPGFQHGKRDYISSLKLRRLIQTRGIKVIHTHDIHGMVDGSICRLLLPGLRLVHTFHFGNYPHRRKRHQLIEGALWRIPDAIVAVGHAQAAAIQDYYGVPADRLQVIWNGVDDPAGRIEHGQLRDIAPPGVPVIGSISTLIPQKGLEFLLQAAASLRKSGERFILVVAGDGVLRDTLHAQARNLGLSDHVRFLGWVPQASDRVLPVADIFVQSSLWEAMSIVVLEAMAASKPMVVTRVGENPHVVIDDETGLTVPPSDPEALAAALRRLLHNRALCRRLGQAARMRYESMFTAHHMVAAYQSLYRSLIDPGVSSGYGTAGHTT